jgi:mRNA interferase HigB
LSALSPRSAQYIKLEIAFRLTRGLQDANIGLVNVISRKALREYGGRHLDAAEALDAWYRRARNATWRNIFEVRVDYPHADAVGRCTVFNIAGNKYRLIVKIEYAAKAIYVKHVLTHSEYNKGRWKNDC